MEFSPARTGAIASVLGTFMEAGSVAEMRALNFVDGPRAKTFFIDSNKPFAAAEVALTWEAEGARGIYFTPNPVRPDLLGGRASSRKSDILERRWFLIDVDPVRPPDCCSTDEERNEAWRVLSACRAMLEEHSEGLTSPVLGDSGNGFHLCYPVDLPNDETAQELLKNLLHQLGLHCDLDGAKVDSKTFDAVRIWKLYGTIARKGEYTPERPHRFTEMLEGEPWEAGAAQANTARLVTNLERMSAIQDVRKGRTQTDYDSYTTAALKQETEAVANAVPGERNQTLNNSSLKLGTLIPGGYLNRERIEEELAAAARRAGLHKDSNCGEAGIAATIRSGIEAGIQRPRDLANVVNGVKMTAGDRKQIPAQKIHPSKINPDDVATIDDLIRAGAEMRWMWPGWLQIGVVNVLAAEAGTGKTRMMADLIRRIRHGLPWPDGTKIDLPTDALALFVMADNHHDEMVNLARDFDIGPNIRINAPRAEPYEGVILEDADDLSNFEGRINAIRPALAIVDTVGNATGLNLSKQEDAKAFYQPLQIIARRQGCCIVCLTHLNASGTVLGRRVKEKARSIIQMDKPDPDDPRRKLWVVKSNSKYPPALGVTMGDNGNEYGSDFPVKPDSDRRRGPNPERLNECCEWLTKWLSESGSKRVKFTRDAAEAEGFSAKLLYDSKNKLKVEEFESESYKWWRLTED